MFDDYNEYGDWDASGSDLDRWEEEQVFQDEQHELDDEDELEDEDRNPWSEFDELVFGEDMED